MIHHIRVIVCRVFGRGCTEDRPASRDLVQEMQDRGRRVQVETYELRRKRLRDIESYFYPPREDRRHE